MKKCLKCAFCREKDKKHGKIYFCNEAGMMATKALLPEYCDRFREKKEVEK